MSSLASDGSYYVVEILVPSFGAPHQHGHMLHVLAVSLVYGRTALTPCLAAAACLHPLPCPAAQVVGVVSRMLGASMALLPIQREGWLSDNEALRRFTRRPQTVSGA